MTCPLCKIQADEGDLIPHPYWQPVSLELAHKMNPDWDESEGCCQHCFDSILQTLDEVTVWKPNFVVRGVADGYRYILSDRQTGNWNHVNPDLQRWWQNIIVNAIGDEAVGAGFEEWFVFDANEQLLAQGMVETR